MKSIFYTIKNLFAFVCHLKIKQKLLLSYIFLTAIIVILAGMVTYWRIASIVRKSLEESTARTINQININISNSLGRIEDISYMIAMDSEIQSILNTIALKKDNLQSFETLSRIETTMRNYIGPQIGIHSAYIVNFKGGIYEVKMQGDVPASIDFDPVIKEQIDRNQGNVLWLINKSNSSLITLARTINHINSIRKLGVLYINVKEEKIREIYQNAIYGKNGRILILDQNGYIISSNDAALRGKYWIMSRSKKGLESGNQFFQGNFGGMDAFIGFNKLDSANWKMVSVISRQEVMKDIFSIRKWLWIICVIALIIAIGLASKISSTISNPIFRLMEQMKKVKEGDLTAKVDIYSEDEVGQLSRNFNSMIQEINSLVNRVYEEQNLKNHAEFKALQAQINPHFLYNTLDSINWLATIHEVEDICRITEALGDLLRSSIRRGNELVPFTEELRYLDNYLLIQKIRYADRLEIITNCNTGNLNIKVPRLILQPLVENAIIHGLEKKIEKGTLLINTAVKEDKFLIEIIDDGVGMTDDVVQTITSGTGKSTGRNTRMGIQNVDKRIKMYFGQEYGLHICSRLNKGTCVTVTLPLFRP